MITVKVAKLGARTVEVTVAEGTTVSDVLRIAEVDASGCQMRNASGATITADTVVSESGLITLVPKVEGGAR